MFVGRSAQNFMHKVGGERAWLLWLGVCFAAATPAFSFSLLHPQISASKPHPAPQLRVTRPRNPAAKMMSGLHGALDLQRAREDTRGCQNLVHLNNAGAALMPAQVSDAYVRWVREEEEEGGYEVAARRKSDLDLFYSACAEMLNCQADEVAFVESASRGWALAFYSLKLERGDRIITSAADYGSNFVSYLQVCLWFRRQDKIRTPRGSCRSDCIHTEPIIRLVSRAGARQIRSRNHHHWRRRRWKSRYFSTCLYYSLDAFWNEGLPKSFAAQSRSLIVHIRRKQLARACLM